MSPAIENAAVSPVVVSPVTAPENTANNPTTAETTAETQNSPPVTLEFICSLLEVSDSIEERIRAARKDREENYNLILKLAKELAEKEPAKKNLIRRVLAGMDQVGGHGKKTGKRGRPKGSKNKSNGTENNGQK